ncbi:MAG: CehA/McbA family metallohydrolase, partial [Actinobacteria bacterium]|nr:CehA/McbA family metallohydrolase [Actinomycetota bacterium]
VPVFTQTIPTEVTARVTLGFGEQAPPVTFGPEPGVVVDEAGWYRGDLHCHTPESSDAWRSGSAMSPAQWAETARSLGLDFLAMTDHNVVSQNLALGDAAGSDVLLMPGEEMTNWFHGHATVSGFDAGDWLDWRQTPGGLPLPTGGARIQDFMAAAKDMGAYVAAAHPLGASLSWQFFADGEADPTARPHGLEVWTGPFQPDDEAALKKWDETLRAGWRVFANGGTDLHGVRNSNGFEAGTPTTVVFAQQLSKRAIVDALKQGRSFVTRLPAGVELYLSARGPSGQAQVVGGTIYGEAADHAAVEILVRQGAGMRLIVLRDGSPISVTTLSSDEQTVPVAVPVGPGGYVRAEVRGRPELDPQRPTAGRLDMEAFTNPIFLVRGEPPAGHRPVTAPPGPPGPRRRRPPAPPPPAGSNPQHPRVLPATGPAGTGVAAPAALAAATVALAGAAVARMTNSEAVHRAGTGDDLAGVPVRLTGQLTAPDQLTRWVAACCSADKAVTVGLELDRPVAAVGSWVEVVGTWVEGTGAGFSEPPRFSVLSVSVLADPPGRLEG